ncbi:MAG: YraN family protein [Oscillospiraceae bacterium]|nr:YraN family protein [Oscillospiraceae bacterium]
MNKVGGMGEDAACEYLQNHGFEIIERNYHSRYGEIDIIARDGDDLVFVEVKARSERTDTMPCEYVDERKRKKIIKTALVYLGDDAYSSGFRFDVTDIIYKNGIPMIKHYRNAFLGGNI